MERASTLITTQQNDLKRIRGERQSLTNQLATERRAAEEVVEEKSKLVVENQELDKKLQDAKDASAARERENIELQQRTELATLELVARRVIEAEQGPLLNESIANFNLDLAEKAFEKANEQTKQANERIKELTGVPTAATATPVVISKQATQSQ